MNNLNTLVSLLNASERNEFVKYLSGRNKRHDVRNVDLFRAANTGKEQLMKDSLGFNAYNVLSKRVSDRLLDFTATKILTNEATAEIGVIKQILVARKLFTFGKFKLGFRIILKAEKAAIYLNHYTLLNEIYHTMIQYSYHESSPDQELVFKKFESNRAEFVAQERLNMVYAVVKKAFNDAEYKGDSVNMDLLLKENFSRFGIDERMAYNFQTLYQLAQIADITGAYNKDYFKANLYFVDQIELLKGGEGDSEKYLIYHIDVLYLVANIFFRKKEFAKSMEFLDSMLEQMNRFKGKFKRDKLVKYATLKALNENFTGDYKSALETLNAVIDSHDYSKEELLNPLLTKVMIMFQQGEIKEAQSIVSRFRHSDLWYERHIGQEWVLNKKYIEILIHIELQNTDLVDSRMNSLVRKYAKLFKTSKANNVLPFLKLIKQYDQQPDIVQSKKFKEQVEKAIEWKPIQQEDIFLSSFYAWLKAKMEGRNLYEVTLELTRPAS